MKDLEENVFSVEEEETANDGFSADSKIKAESNDEKPRVESPGPDDSLFMVPKELIEEEAKVKAQNEVTEKKEREKAAEYLDGLSKTQRYEKLMSLLGKSQIYSDYLKDKMEMEDEAKVLKKQKLEDRKKLKERLSTDGKKRARTNKRKRDEEEEDDDEPLARAKAKKIRPDIVRTLNGEDIPDEQPLLLSGGIMRDYQIKGYQWISTLFENDINGILADEMGLGKTIQTIALFCHLVEMGVPGPFLIVAPLSTVKNWINEFKKFAPLFPTVLYHGTKPEREILRRKKLGETAIIEEIDKKVKNVFVTSYEIAINDRAFLSHVKWRYIVVDEGHRLKNKNCKLIQELKKYSSVNKLLLTGTPLQNNLSELWSLLNFIMPEIFDDLRVFESWFDAKEMDSNLGETGRILEQEKQKDILTTLHKILTPFLLRRVKADVDMAIPPKKEMLVYCPMSERQREMYEATVNRTISELVGPKDEDNENQENLVNVPAISDKRAKRDKPAIDYSVFLGTEAESEKEINQYHKILADYHKQKEEMKASVCMYERSNDRFKTDVNFSVKNRMMDLRKSTNHPYLIEHPLTEDGMFYEANQDMIDICGKLKVLDQMLVELVKRNHKVLIFSQMTRMLTILEDYLNFKKLRFSRLDGSMGFEDRQENIDSFTEDPEVKVFLLSTRAGGLGINLTAADTCIIYDSDWNPQQDLQAQDRCHRIGQTKPVIVYRLVTANTIDQRIVERAAAKRRLEKMIIHSKKFKSQDTEGLKKTMEKISPQELLDLLNSKDHAGVVDRKAGTVFSEAEMEALLDRRDMIHAGADVKQPVIKKKKNNKNKLNEKQEVFKIIDLEEANKGMLMSVKED